MKKKRWLVLLFCLAVLCAVWFACCGRRPYKDLQPSDIVSATVRLSPPDKTVPVTDIPELTGYLRQIVIYLRDNSHTAYAGQAVCLDMTPYMNDGDELDITAVMEKNKDLIRKGDIIVLYTGYEERVGTMEYFDFKDFNGNTGEILEKYGCKGIGFDMPSIDRSGNAHQAVLSRGMSILESLINLKPLIGKHFFLSAVPLKFADGDGSPVRAYAITED